MGNVVKMDLYRMLKSLSFRINLLLVFVLSIAVAPVGNMITKLLGGLAMDNNVEGAGDLLKKQTEINFSELLSTPLYLSLMLLFVILCLIHFSYADISGGYIKNIAGQLPQKGYTVISKFIVIGIINFAFLFSGVIGQVIGESIVRKVVFDVSSLGSGIATFLIRWLLLQSICSILLFLTTGLRSKTFATVAGVVLSTGMLGLSYIAVDQVISRFFNVSDDFTIAQYAPDQMLKAASFAYANAIIVSVVIIAIFLPMTVKLFNKHDVK